MKKTNILIVIMCLGLFIGVAGCTNNSNEANSVSSVALVRKTKKKVPKKKKSKIRKIKIKVNGHTLKAHLNDSSAATDFSKKLPTKLTFVDFSNGAEKMADLHYSLSTKGMPKGHAGTKGSIGYWSPDRRIIFYYGHVDYYPGIHIIGKFDSKNYAKIIKGMKDHTKVVFSIVK